jgi:hypothetical protein
MLSKPFKIPLGSKIGKSHHIVMNNGAIVKAKFESARTVFFRTEGA